MLSSYIKAPQERPRSLQGALQESVLQLSKVKLELAALRLSLSTVLEVDNALQSGGETDSQRLSVLLDFLNGHLPATCDPSAAQGAMAFAAHELCKAAQDSRPGFSLYDLVQPASVYYDVMKKIDTDLTNLMEDLTAKEITDPTDPMRVRVGLPIESTIDCLIAPFAIGDIVKQATKNQPHEVAYVFYNYAGSLGSALAHVRGTQNIGQPAHYSMQLMDIVSTYFKAQSTAHIISTPVCQVEPWVTAYGCSQ